MQFLQGNRGRIKCWVVLHLLHFTLAKEKNVWFFFLQKTSK